MFAGDEVMKEIDRHRAKIRAWGGCAMGEWAILLGQGYGGQEGDGKGGEK
jgi:hypothetical protein